MRGPEGENEGEVVGAGLFRDGITIGFGSFFGCEFVAGAFVCGFKLIAAGGSRRAPVGLFNFGPEDVGEGAGSVRDRIAIGFESFFGWVDTCGLVSTRGLTGDVSVAGNFAADGGVVAPCSLGSGFAVRAGVNPVVAG